MQWMPALAACVKRSQHLRDRTETARGEIKERCVAKESEKERQVSREGEVEGERERESQRERRGREKDEMQVESDPKQTERREP